MTRKDMSEAAIALIRWIESQDIKTTDAVPVLVVALFSLESSKAWRWKTKLTPPRARELSAI